MDNIALGKYLPLNSVVHRFDPRAKIIAMFLLMISVFFNLGIIGHVMMSCFLIFVTLLAKLQLNFIWRAMKPMLFMLSFLLVIILYCKKAVTFEKEKEEKRKRIETEGKII